jgi:hypothetical protein
MIAQQQHHQIPAVLHHNQEERPAQWSIIFVRTIVSTV